MDFSNTIRIENLPVSSRPANEVDSDAEALAIIRAELGGAPKRLYETRDGEPITFDTHKKGKQSGGAYVNRKDGGRLVTYWGEPNGEKHTLFIRDNPLAHANAHLPVSVRQDTGNAERAARAAAEVWGRARPVGADHPYLQRKQVKPTDTLRELRADELEGIIGYRPKADGALLEGRILIAPVAIGDAISTIELIDEQGRKSALAGGRKSGGYWATGTLPDTGRVVITEGVATALSIAEALGETVVAALSVNNLEKVGRALQRPGRELVIAADLGKDGKPHEEAVKAAVALKARLCAPASDLGKGGDFNDLHVRDGLDAVRAVFANPGVPGEVRDKNALLCRAIPYFSDLENGFEEARWLWRYWLPRGAFVVLAGAPGAGKTTAAISIAANVSTGSFPMGELGRPHDVLFFTREDSYRAAVLPKLAAAGADLSRVRALEGLPDAGCGVTPFDPANDAGRLKDLLLGLPTDKRPALVIIDGIADAVKRDSHNNTDVRHALLPYVELARETDACVIGITHFSKNSKGRLPIDRVMGSVAFAAMARVVIAVRYNQGKEGLPERIFAQVKNNLAEQQPVEGFKIEPATATIRGRDVQTSVATWTGPVRGNAYQALEALEQCDDNPDGEPDDEKAIALREACDFLQDALCDGARPAMEVIREAQDAGISPATLRRARLKLGVKPSKGGFDEGWLWGLPTATSSGGAPEGAQASDEDDHHAERCSSSEGCSSSAKVWSSSTKIQPSSDASAEDAQASAEDDHPEDAHRGGCSSSEKVWSSSTKIQLPSGGPGGQDTPAVPGGQADSGQGNLPPWKAGKTTTGASAAPRVKSEFEQLVEKYRRMIEAAWWMTGENLRGGQPFVGRDELVGFLTAHRKHAPSKAQAEVNPSSKGGLIHTLLEAGVLVTDSDGFRVVDRELAASLIERSNGDRLGPRKVERTDTCLPTPVSGGDSLNAGAEAEHQADNNPTIETATEPSLPGAGRAGDARLCDVCDEPMTLEADGWACPTCGF